MSVQMFGNIINTNEWVEFNTDQIITTNHPNFVSIMTVKLNGVEIQIYANTTIPAWQFNREDYRILPEGLPRQKNAFRIEYSPSTKCFLKPDDSIKELLKTRYAAIRLNPSIHSINFGKCNFDGPCGACLYGSVEAKK